MAYADPLHPDAGPIDLRAYQPHTSRRKPDYQTRNQSGQAGNGSVASPLPHTTLANDNVGPEIRDADCSVRGLERQQARAGKAVHVSSRKDVIMTADMWFWIVAVALSVFTVVNFAL